MQKNIITYNGKEVIFYSEPSSAAKPSIVLMHGYSFNSEIWEKTGVVDALKGNFNVIALDVPGFPRSANQFDMPEEEFLGLVHKIASTAPGCKVVLLGASASGYIAMRFAELHESDLLAMVLVGPVRLSRKVLSGLSVKILGIWGSEDKTSDPKAGSAMLKAAKSARAEIIEGAGHACYIDNPNEFIGLLLKFLNSVI